MFAIVSVLNSKVVVERECPKACVSESADLLPLLWTKLRRAASEPHAGQQCRKSAGRGQRVLSARSWAEEDWHERIEKDAWEPNADRKQKCRVIMNLRIKAPPTRCDDRSKVSVSNLVQSQCTTLNVNTFRVASSFSPLLFTGRSPCLASARSLFRISSESARDGCLRNFRHSKPLSHCYELQLAETRKLAKPSDRR